MKPSIHVTLYSRAACHLCEEMHAVVTAVGRDYDLRLEEIDIDTDPALQSRYNTEIPVLAIEGRKAFKYRVTAAALRARLDQALRARATDVG